MAVKIEDFDFQLDNLEFNLDSSVSGNNIEMELDPVQQVTTSDHDKLQNRSKPNQHPIEAITDLITILNEKTNAKDVLSNMEILKILER